MVKNYNILNKKIMKMMRLDQSITGFKCRVYQEINIIRPIISPQDLLKSSLGHLKKQREGF